MKIRRIGRSLARGICWEFIRTMSMMRRVRIVRDMVIILPWLIMDLCPLRRIRICGSTNQKSPRSMYFKFWVSSCKFTCCLLSHLYQSTQSSPTSNWWPFRVKFSESLKIRMHSFHLRLMCSKNHHRWPSWSWQSQVPTVIKLATDLVLSSDFCLILSTLTESVQFD